MGIGSFLRDWVGIVNNITGSITATVAIWLWILSFPAVARWRLRRRLHAAWMGTVGKTLLEQAQAVVVKF
jgi:hypothetical protein